MIIFSFLHHCKNLFFCQGGVVNADTLICCNSLQCLCLLCVVYSLLTKARSYSAIPVYFPLPVPAVLYLACLYSVRPLRTSTGYDATVSSPEYAGCYSWLWLPVVPAAVLSRMGRSEVSPLVSQEDTGHKNVNKKQIKSSAIFFLPTFLFFFSVFFVTSYLFVCQLCNEP